MASDRSLTTTASPAPIVDAGDGAAVVGVAEDEGPGTPMPGEPIGGPVLLDEVALGASRWVAPSPGRGRTGGEPLGSSFADEVPTLPQHSAFGSVWDSQIGVLALGARQTGPAPTSRRPRRRARGARVPPGRDGASRTRPPRRSQRGGGGGRGGGGYRSAIDRERYGAGGSAATAPGKRVAAQGVAHQATSSGQPAAQPSSQHAAPIEQTAPTSAEPWSEVPPDVQELLRAERRRGASASSATPVAARRGETARATPSTRRLAPASGA